MGPSVGPPIQKRGRLSGRSGDLLGARPLEKVGRSLLNLLFIFLISVVLTVSVKTNPPKVKHLKQKLSDS